MAAVKALADRVAAGQAAAGAHTMQDLALAALLQARCVTIPASDSRPGMVLFRLFVHLELGSCPLDWQVNIDGVQYLLLEYLKDNTDNDAAQAPAEPEAGGSGSGISA